MRTINKTIKTARRLRKQMSLPEVMLWQRLRGREEGKPVFRRQHPMARTCWISSARMLGSAWRSTEGRTPLEIGLTRTDAETFS